MQILAAGVLLLAAGCGLLGANLRSNSGVIGTGFSSSDVHRLALAASPLTAAQVPSDDSNELQARARALFAGLPLIFEPNLGQANLDPSDSRARFFAHGSGYSIFLGPDGAILSLSSRDAEHRTRVESFQMKIAGANHKVDLTAVELLPGKSNYFLGDDPKKWRRGVPQFARVRYENIYPGVNLVFYGNQGRLEYDFQIGAGADANQPELEFAGAKRLEIKDGSLAIVGESGSVQFEAPRIYQEIAGRKQPVEGKFVLRGANRVGFAVEAYDHSRELIIDPILSFSTYFGGSGNELNSSIAVDGTFNIYLTGSTTSPNLPVTSPPALAPCGFLTCTTLNGPQNVYIAKITPPLGSLAPQLDYVAYLGGGGMDAPVGIKVDGSGDPFVAGTTTSGIGSTDFPTTKTNAYQTEPEAGSAGKSHVFVTELKYDFSQLLYSSYLSGNNTDVASGMTIDSSGNIYVTGTTMSNDAASTSDQFPASTYPQAFPFQTAPRAPTQFFVTKVVTTAPGTGSIGYSTYFGGGASQTTPAIVNGGGIAIDTGGNAYFTGSTNFTYTGCAGCGTTDFPILNAYQYCLDQPPTTTVVTPPTCTNTSSGSSNPDAFVAKLNLNPNVAQGNQLIWSTYLGGSGIDSGTGIALDSGAANVYLTGTTNSSDFVLPLTTAAYQACLDQPGVAAGSCTPPTGTVPTDAFVARFTNPTSSTTTTPTPVALNYFSYLGGSTAGGTSGNDAGLAITVDSASGALVTGWTQSADFPVFQCGPLQCGFTGAGTTDAFIARLNTVAVTGQTTTGSWASYFGGSATSVSGATPTTMGMSIALDVNQNTYFAGDTNTSGSSTGIPVIKPLFAYAGGYDAFVTQLNTAVSLSISGVLTLGSSQTFISAGNPATFTYTITNTGPDLATNIALTDNLSPAVTGIPLTFDSASISSGSCGGASSNAIVSCSLPSLQSGSTATLTIVVTPTPNSGGTQATFNGGSVQALGPGNIVLAQTSVPAQMSDFGIAVSPTNASVGAAGQTAIYGVQVTPHPIYTSPITLSCSGLPTGASCNFTNNSFTLPTGPASSTLNLTTTVRPITTTTAQIFPLRGLHAMWLAVPGLAVFVAGIGGNRRRRFLGLFLLCLVFVLCLFLPACSHTTTQPPTSGTPAGTYTITVTATSNADTKSSAITLTVP